LADRMMETSCSWICDLVCSSSLLTRRAFSSSILANKAQIQEVDGRLQKEYENKLAAAIKELRSECTAQMNHNKEEQEILYNKKEADSKAEAQRAKDALAAKTAELKNLTTDLDGNNKKLAALEGEKHTLEQNYKELEKKSGREKGFGESREE